MTDESAGRPPVAAPDVTAGTRAAPSELLDAELETLEARGLIEVAAYRPELEYLFRHWLIQDAAYGSLLKQERRELHRLVGEAVESLYPDRHDEMAGVLAMHFEQAGDTPRAVEYLLADGHYALDRNAIREAHAAFDRAASLLPRPGPDATEPTRRQWVDVQLLRARAGWPFLPTSQVLAELQAIVPEVEQLGDPELAAQAHLQIAFIGIEAGSAPDPLVARSMERLAELASVLDDPSLAALPLALRAMNKVFTGPIGEGVAALESAIPLMEKRRDFIGAAFARGWLAMGYAQLGEFEKAEAASREATRQAAAGDVIAQLDAQIAEAMVRSLRGELDEAEPLAVACVDRSQESGATYCAVVSAWILGDVYQRQGRPQEAGQALQLGLDISPGLEPGMWGPTLQAWIRANAATLGDSKGSDEGWDEPLAETRRSGNRLSEAAVLWKRAEAAIEEQRWETAFRDLARSASILEEQGARPNLARLTRGWGTALRSAGHADEGDEKLRQALALFEAMGLEREAQQVRDELARAPGPR